MSDLADDVVDAIERQSSSEEDDDDDDEEPLDPMQVRRQREWPAAPRMTRMRHHLIILVITHYVLIW